MNSNNYVISKDLLDALLEYLEARPCKEVMEGVLALKGLPTYESVKALHDKQTS